MRAIEEAIQFQYANVLVVNLDKKGCVSPPKAPPLMIDLKCPKCESPLNLRRGAKGPWLSCSKFPKCRGRLGWAPLDDETKNRLENALKKHEDVHPQPIIQTLDGDSVGGGYRPKLRNFEQNTIDINND